MSSNLKRVTAVLAMLGVLTSTGINTWAADAPATPAAKNTELFSGLVVAKGKGVEVKRDRIDQELVAIKSSAAARGQTIAPDQMQMLEQQILQRLIQMQILLGRATDADRARGKELSKQRFDAIKERAGSDEALNRQLTAVGMKLEELQSRMLEEATAEAVLERELNITVSDADIKKFYDENPSKFEQPEQVRAAHVLLMTQDPQTKQELPADKKEAKKKQAEEIVKRARAGEDFAKLAKEFSEDPGSKDKGGEYTFPRGQMVPEFEASAFSLGTNQVSDVVTTQFGYHVIKTYEKIPAKKIELEKVKNDVRDYLKQQQASKVVGPHMEKLMKEAGVEITDARLKPREPAPTLDIPPPVTEKPSTNK